MTRYTLWLRSIAIAVSFCALTALAIAESVARDPLDSPYAIPQNYREMIARHILATTDPDTIRRAQITTPRDSVAHGSDEKRTVCASVWLKGAVIEPSYVVGFIFLAGEIHRTFNPDDNNPKVGEARAAVIKFGPTCDFLSYVPFPEIQSSR
jgi:hypothetical protein